MRDRLVGVERGPDAHLRRRRQAPRHADLRGALVAGADRPVPASQVAESGCERAEGCSDSGVVGGVGQLDAAGRRGGRAGCVAGMADRRTQRDGAARELPAQRHPTAGLAQDLHAVVHRARSAVDDEDVACAPHREPGAVTGVVLGAEIVEIGGGDGGDLVAGDVVDDVDVHLEESGTPGLVVAERVAGRNHAGHLAELPGQLVHLCVTIGWRCGARADREQRHGEQKADTTALVDAHQPIVPTRPREGIQGTPRLLSAYCREGM